MWSRGLSLRSRRGLPPGHGRRWRQWRLWGTARPQGNHRGGRTQEPGPRRPPRPGRAL